MGYEVKNIFIKFWEGKRIYLTLTIGKRDWVIIGSRSTPHCNSTLTAMPLEFSQGPLLCYSLDLELRCRKEFEDRAMKHN